MRKKMTLCTILLAFILMAGCSGGENGANSNPAQQPTQAIASNVTMAPDGAFTPAPTNTTAPTATNTPVPTATNTPTPTPVYEKIPGAEQVGGFEWVKVGEGCLDLTEENKTLVKHVTMHDITAFVPAGETALQVQVSAHISAGYSKSSFNGVEKIGNYYFASEDRGRKAFCYIINEERGYTLCFNVTNDGMTEEDFKLYFDYFKQELKKEVRRVSENYAIAAPTPTPTLEEVILPYLNYMIEDGEITITGYSGDYRVEELAIPAQINGYPVTKIDDKAFGCGLWTVSYVKKITIPDTVKEIGASAFARHDNLEEFSFPSVLEKIGEQAFIETAIKELSLPETLKEIGAYAFCSCDYITEIVLPDSVTMIGESAFAECGNVKKVVLPSGLGRIEASVFCGTQITAIEIPASVTAIGDAAFGGCPIAELVLPEGLESIGREAFTGIHAEKVIIPDTVSAIGVGAFIWCENLKEVVLGKNVSFIGDAAFAECYNLTLTVKKDSYAENYAKENGIPYQVK